MMEASILPQLYLEENESGFTKVKGPFRFSPLRQALCVLPHFNCPRQNAKIIKIVRILILFENTLHKFSVKCSVRSVISEFSRILRQNIKRYYFPQAYLN